jgi:uncharacterized membrane protein
MNKSTAAKSQKGHLYRSVGASGAQAEQARQAVAKRGDLADGVAVDDLVKSRRKAKDKKKSKIATKSTGAGNRLSLLSVIFAVILIPVAAAVVEALVVGQIGLISNVTFAVLVVLSAVFVSKDDLFAPAVAAPIGYFLVLVAVGLLEVTGTNFFPRLAAWVVLELGTNALWLLLPTAAAAGVGVLRAILNRRAEQQP